MENKYQEKISVLLATYNGSRFLREQLDSILQQTYSNFELLLCDDCSTDSTYSLIEEYTHKDSRIRVFQNEQNLGFKKNFEHLLTLASCDYIALSDQDDIWTSNHLELLMDNLGKNDLVCGNAYLADGDGKSTGVTLLDCSHFDFLPETQEDWFFYLLHGNVFQGAACLFRKKLIAELLPIPDSVKYHDYWLAIHAAMRGGVKYLENPILYYRQHGNNVTTNKKWNLIGKIRQAFGWKLIRQEVNARLCFLNAVQQVIADENKKKVINEALRYYKNTQEKFHCFHIKYFCKNYTQIYLSKNKALFIMRFVKKFFLWK